MYEYLDGLNTLIEGSRDGKKTHPKKTTTAHRFSKAQGFQKHKIFQRK